MSRLSKADKVAIGELTVNLLGQSHVMVAKARLVSTQTGMSYGSMTMQNWSPEVIKKLEELRALMEQELESVFFDEGGAVAPRGPSPREAGGLGEMFEGDGHAPQV